MPARLFVRTKLLPIFSQGFSCFPVRIYAHGNWDSKHECLCRVTPLGHFTGFEDSIDFFFALALVPSAPTHAVFSRAKIVSFSSGCPSVTASVSYLETRALDLNAMDSGRDLSTLEQVAFWTSDDAGAVSAYNPESEHLGLSRDR